MAPGRPDELSHLQSQISDLTAVLSLIMKTASGLQEQDGQLRGSGKVFPDDPETDHEMDNENLDEDDFEDPIVNKAAEDDAVKRKTLDRLAEVSARTKTTRDNRMPRKRNVDAKHVTSVVLFEDPTGKFATFIFSKNGGFDGVDKDLLSRLETLLRSTASNGELKLYLLSLYVCLANSLLPMTSKLRGKSTNGSPGPDIQHDI